MPVTWRRSRASAIKGGGCSTLDRGPRSAPPSHYQCDGEPEKPFVCKAFSPLDGALVTGLVTGVEGSTESGYWSPVGRARSRTARSTGGAPAVTNSLGAAAPQGSGDGCPTVEGWCWGSLSLLSLTRTPSPSASRSPHTPPFAQGGWLRALYGLPRASWGHPCARCQTHQRPWRHTRKQSVWPTCNPPDGERKVAPTTEQGARHQRPGRRSSDRD